MLEASILCCKALFGSTQERTEVNDSAKTAVASGLQLIVVAPFTARVEYMLRSSAKAAKSDCALVGHGGLEVVQHRVRLQLVIRLVHRVVVLAGRPAVDARVPAAYGIGLAKWERCELAPA